MRGHFQIMEKFLGIMSHLPTVREPVMKGHLVWDIEVFLEDGINCMITIYYNIIYHHTVRLPYIIILYITILYDYHIIILYITILYDYHIL